jgi:hypothetical protein
MVTEIKPYRRAFADGGYMRWDNRPEISVNIVFQSVKGEG